MVTAMYPAFLTSPLGTCLMPTCFHLIFTLNKETGMEGKTVLREAVLIGTAHPAAPPCTLPCWQTHPLLCLGLVYASPSPTWDSLFLT